MLTQYADLEIDVYRADEASYTVDLRYTSPDGEGIQAPERGRARFDFEQLREQALRYDSAAYGASLWTSLFGESTFQAKFEEARRQAQAQDAGLRIRLFIEQAAPELHDLWWETLHQPQERGHLTTNEQILFSRYLRSRDWQPFQLRRQSQLRALAVIANPTNLAEYDLAPLNVTGELTRITATLSGIPVTILQSGGGLPPTLNRLIEHLRDDYDILYLVAHGTLRGQRPRLWLEDENHRADVVSGGELVTRLEELGVRPRLVVLASCESAAGSQDAAGAWMALGPRLAEAGVPAVLAMQGEISLPTLETFMTCFFRELQRDGVVDRATAAARGTVREQADAWVPVLFMRLRSGRLWYIPGFSDRREKKSPFERWRALIEHIAHDHCTPVLGSGLIEPLVGSSREIAAHWAETYGFPLDPQARDDLPQVAQYLAVHEDNSFPRYKLTEYLSQELLRRADPQLAAALQQAPLAELLREIGAWRRAQDPAELHQVLASLPFPVYITTNQDDLLADALRAAGKHPEIELCRWNEALALSPSIFDTERTYRPDKDRPLVYHLFGRLENVASLVLTEDDYFDYLIGVTSNKELIPPVVRRALAGSALIFLGFRLDDWEFRVLFRSIMSQPGRTWRQVMDYVSVAVQIDPEGGHALEPERARQFLQTYFQGADVSIYWGRPEDFVRELAERWTTRNSPPPAAPPQDKG